MSKRKKDKTKPGPATQVAGVVEQAASETVPGLQHIAPLPEMPLIPLSSVVGHQMRVVYGCPVGNTPSGGVKVIYRHAELLAQMGVPAFVWHPGDPNFRCDWFQNHASTIANEQLNPATDFIILPEIWATGLLPSLKSMGFRVGLFVQNAYYTHVNLNPANPNAIHDAYRDVDLVLSISTDTSRYLEDVFQVPSNKIVLQRYSIDFSLFRPSAKTKTITFMPRKMGQHSARVVSALQPLLPAGWSIVALDKMSEREVAHNLSQSIIFMAFSEFEGLPVPPVEAALCGNVVIGYHGQGGKEYWHAPNFIEVDQGDVQGFLFEVRDALAEIESGQINVAAMNEGIQRLATCFSLDNETGMLRSLVDSIRPMYPVAGAMHAA